MKNKALIYVLLAGGAIVLLSMKKKKPGYKIIVPEPEKITAQQFAKPSLIQKAAPVAKTIFSLFKRKPKLTAQQQATAAALSKGSILRGVGQFPDMC
jgi:hypothetical protein